MNEIAPGLPRFKNLVEDRSGGRIQIQVFLGGEHPLGIDDYAPAVRDRLFDMAYQSTGYLSAVAPLASMLDLPFLVAGGGGIPELDDMFEKFRGEIYDPVFDKYNMVSLLQWRWGMVVPVLRSKLVPTLDSLRGVKIRSYSKLMTDGLAALGAAPVTLSWEEMMTAIQRGVVDGLIMDVRTSYVYAIFELCKFYTYMNFNNETAAVGMNKAAFNELPQDLRDLMMQAGKEVDEWSKQNRRTEDGVAALASVIDYGVTLGRMPPSEERKAAEKMKPLWDEWAAKVGPQGPDLLKRILAYHEEWISTHK